MSIHNRIKGLAKLRGTTIKELVSSLGYGKTIVNSWEQKEPSAYKVKDLAVALKTTTDYLLELTDSPTVFYPTSKVSGKKLELLLRLQDMDLSDEQSEIIMGYLDETENFSHLNKGEVK